MNNPDDRLDAALQMAESLSSKITSNPDDPRIGIVGAGGQMEAYLVLSEEERKKGFVRPLRRSYKHVGIRPKYPLCDLTEEQRANGYGDMGYTKYEKYPDSESPCAGRYWTEKDLTSGCQFTTTMGLALCETYARSPGFYGATFCCGCGTHLPVAEFVWCEDGARVGS